MEIDLAHFSNQLLPRHKLDYLARAKKLDPVLMQILVVELQKGNKIHDVRIGSFDEIEVSLEHPFHAVYTIDGVHMMIEKDAHYGGTFYTHPSYSKDSLHAR
jgi:hypothetical protein